MKYVGNTRLAVISETSVPFCSISWIVVRTLELAEPSFLTELSRFKFGKLCETRDVEAASEEYNPDGSESCRMVQNEDEMICVDELVQSVKICEVRKGFHDASCAACPLHIVGNATRLGAGYGIGGGIVLGGIASLAIQFSQGVDSLTLAYYMITVCTGGLGGVALGMVQGFRQLHINQTSQGSKS